MALIPYPPPERPPDDQMDERTREFWRRSEEARALEYMWSVATLVIPLLLVVLLKLLAKWPHSV